MATPPTATSGLAYSHGQPFDTVLRGYERRQVDDFVAKSNDEIIRLKEDLAEAQRQCRLVAEHAEATERELHELQGKSAHAKPIAAEDSFGFRAEKLLRLAEQEAADMRTCATRNAEAVEAAARQRAEEQLRVAEAQAEDIRARASEEAASRRTQVSQEAARLDRLYRSMKGEIQRLAELLTIEAQRPDPDGGPARADPHLAPPDGRGPDSPPFGVDALAMRDELRTHGVDLSDDKLYILVDTANKYIAEGDMDLDAWDPRIMADVKTLWPDLSKAQVIDVTRCAAEYIERVLARNAGLPHPPDDDDHNHTVEGRGPQARVAGN